MHRQPKSTSSITSELNLHTRRRKDKNVNIHRMMENHPKSSRSTQTTVPNVLIHNMPKALVAQQRSSNAKLVTSMDTSPVSVFPSRIVRINKVHIKISTCINRMHINIVHIN